MKKKRVVIDLTLEEQSGEYQQEIPMKQEIVHSKEWVPKPINNIPF